MNEQPIAEKSKLGDLWKITHGDRTIFTNQAGVERYLNNYNEKQK